MSEVGKRLIESAEQALAFAEGRAAPETYRVHIPEEIDVRHIRKRFHMSQAQFAREFGFSVRTLLPTGFGSVGNNAGCSKLGGGKIRWMLGS